MLAFPVSAANPELGLGREEESMGRNSDEKPVSVTVKEEQGGVTATVVTNEGNVYTGRDHPSYHWDRSVSDDRAIRDAVNKVGK